MSTQEPIIKQFLPETVVEPLGFNIVDVNISIDGVVAQEYFESLWFELLMLVPGQTINPDLLTLDALINYCKTIIYNRVLYVRGESSRRVLFHPTEKFAMPSFINLCCNNIGKASRFGDTLMPQMEFGNPMPLNEMTKISNYLKTFGRVGFQYAEGFDRNKDGDFAVMSIWCIQDKVVATSLEAHPSYGFIMSFLKAELTNQILLPKVKYGEFNYFSSRIGKLAQAEFSKKN